MSIQTIFRFAIIGPRPTAKHLLLNPTLIWRMVTPWREY